MNNSFISAIVSGWITILLLILLSSGTLSLIVRLTTISELTLSYITLAIGLLSLFIGGIFAGVKGKENGWIVGLITGGGFTFLTFLIQYLGFNELFSLHQIIYHSTYVLAAIIGSILGVNLSPATKVN